MKTFAVLDTDHTGRLISQGHTEAIPQIFGHVYLTDVVQEELGDWKGKNAESVKEFAKNPPEWVIKQNPTAIAPEVEAFNRDKTRLDPGEASAVSLALELSRDGSCGVVLSDDGRVRQFLNHEQNPTKAQELAADNRNTFGMHGPTLPAPENQKIFAANLWSSLSQAGERRLVPDFHEAVDKAKDAGVTPSKKVENKLNQFSDYLQETQQTQKVEQERAGQQKSHEHDQEIEQ